MACRNSAATVLECTCGRVSGGLPFDTLLFRVGVVQSRSLLRPANWAQCFEWACSRGLEPAFKAWRRTRAQARDYMRVQGFSRLQRPQINGPGHGCVATYSHRVCPISNHPTCRMV